MSTASSFAKAKAASAPAKAASSTANLKASVAVVATVCYTNNWEKDEQSDAFSALFAVEPDEETLEGLKSLVEDHAEALTGDRNGLGPRHHQPLRSGDEIGTNGGYSFKDPLFRGKVVFRAKSKFAPVFLDSDGNNIEPSMIRGGDKVAVEVGAYHFNNQSAGVAISLGGVMLLEKGERVIERGGSAGGALRKFSSSGLTFKKPGSDNI